MQEFDFYAVMEQTTPTTAKTQIIEQKEDRKTGLTYLKFRSCMQDYIGRNRNGRLWNGRYMKELLRAPHIIELLEKGFPGENGHPVPSTGEVSMARIMTIDPNNISHKILNFQWEGDERVFSDVETVCDINGPGTKFALNIMQGFEPAFSVRAVVPQRRNKDGTIDVMQGGRVVTFDRVFLPSHRGAYRDTAISVKQVTSAPEYEQIMESLTNYAIDKSDRVNYAMEGTNPISGSAYIDRKTGHFTVNTEKGGRIFVPMEKKISAEIGNYMKNIL